MALIQDWPTQPDNDLRVDTAWRERYSGETINRKFNRILHGGVYYGFTVMQPDTAGLTVKVGGIGEESIAVVECQGRSLTARMPENMIKSVPVQAGKTQYVVLEASYAREEITTIRLVAVDAVKTNDGHCTLARVTVPAGATAVTDDMIENIDPVALIAMPQYVQMTTALANVTQQQLDIFTRLDDIIGRLAALEARG